MIQIEAGDNVFWQDHEADTIEAPRLRLAVEIALVGKRTSGPILRLFGVMTGRVAIHWAIGFFRPLPRLGIPPVALAHPLLERLKLGRDRLRNDWQWNRLRRSGLTCRLIGGIIRVVRHLQHSLCLVTRHGPQSSQLWRAFSLHYADTASAWASAGVRSRP